MHILHQYTAMPKTNIQWVCEFPSHNFSLGISALGQIVSNSDEHDHVWIGLSDLFYEGTFEWTDGTPLDYVNFANPTQPDNVGDGIQDCVQLWADEQSTAEVVYKKWNDNNCNAHMRAYICKKPSSKLNNGSFLYFNKEKKFFSYHSI